MSVSREYVKLSSDDTPLKKCVNEELKAYFTMLDGQEPSDLHDLVIGQVEEALIRFVLERCKSNRSRAAEILGINRGTLRKKLKEHGI